MSSKAFAKSKLKLYQEIFNPHIQKFLNDYVKNTSPQYIHTKDFLGVLKDIVGTRAGKRGRAAFVYYVYKMYGGANRKVALDMGIVIELIHGYLLLIDDFMDRSETRRHGPSAHKMLEKFYLDQGFTKGDPSHFGNSLAVNVGLTASHIAMNFLSDLNVSSDTKLALFQNLNSKIEITSYGQMHDVTNAASLKASENDVLKTLEWKSGVYTYENPIHSGAILAGFSDQKELDYLSSYAIPAGVAFQIQDDILGVFGNDSETGKCNLDDIKEGKYTLLVHTALKRANTSQKAVLLKSLGNLELTEDNHDDVKQIIQETGSLDYCKEKAVGLVVKAKDSLIDGRRDFFEKEGFDYLLGISDYMIDRKI